MSGDVSVRRVDDRLGLAVCRAGLSARTLVTYARDHVIVRTPSAPGRPWGNSLDLEAPPGPGDLQRWVARFGETVGAVGARQVQLRWEVAADRSGPDPAGGDLVDAAAALGLQLATSPVHLLDTLTGPDRAPPLEIAPVAPPSAVPGAHTDRRWHAATVLYRYARGDTPADWRDPVADDWPTDVQRELTAAMRCRVWVAMRHGGPVARATLLHDRQGLAVVEDVITHPVHRGLGIATQLVHRAVREHLVEHPGSRVGVALRPTEAARRLFEGLGFRAHATVCSARSRGGVTGAREGELDP